MVGAPNEMKGSGAHPGEFSHARDKEVPSSYTDDVLVRLNL